MQHKKQFLDRPKGPAQTPPKDAEHVSATFPDVIRRLAERHDISEQEAIRRLKGKATD